MLWMRVFDQAATSLMPSVNFTPWITSGSNELPFSTHHRVWADWASLKTIIKLAIRLPQPLVL